MSDNSAIEWTDASWNPVIGCTEVTPGCDNCYAKTFAERWRGIPGHYFEQGFDVMLRPDKLNLPLRWRKPRRIFVNSMSDLFHKDVPDEYIAQVWTVMAATPQHTYQLLTKRHARMRSVVRRIAWRSPTTEERQRGVTGSQAYVQADESLNDRLGAPRILPNVWVGVSVEDQKRADLRIPALLDTPAAVRWLSCEPLLGPVDLDQPRCQYHDRDEVSSDGSGQEWCGDCIADGSTGELSFGHWLDPLNGGIDWVVVGGESGLRSRPMQVDWARDLRNQCTAADVPFFFKQWGGRTPKANGRELDGRTWDEYPRVAEAGDQ